ncbi:ABC transporter ATP-binding protein [Streptomyces sp. N2-109]|uniref:ABC transporter ATP-binding protein n=1 Tax=Streptomyces gossypii TaxID=2883101 RepID=A0ABT2JVT5_9ACTN|nr:ABC transporter ATP-binding protein [Streptomyces gossypii]MCT2591783.1 ABC transporter ATP-binding protein [Streptomyces gossypii]
MFRAHDARTGASAEALRLVSVRKVYGTAENQVTALDGVSLSLPAGTFTAVMGPSGSGKSTLLQCAAGLDDPTSGIVAVDGAELSGGGEAELTRFRRRRIGFVFQQFNLLDTLTVLENVTLPLRLSGKRVRRGRAEETLARVGLGERLRHRPSELSGGQQQRVAIARALVTEPNVIFADEPTGALDTAGARNVLGLLQEAVQAYGQTVVMVTHDPVAAAYAGSVLFLADGRLAGRIDGPTAETVAARMAHLGDEAQPGVHAEEGVHAEAGVRGIPAGVGEFPVRHSVR